MKDQVVDGPAEPSLSGSRVLSVGARLAAARQALGLSVADVARQIKLSVPQVVALEADDLSRLPKSSVIVKGFLRNYARLVQLDPDALVGAVQPPPADEQSKGRYRRREVEFDRANRPWLGVLGGLLVIAVLLGAYEYYVNPDFFAFPPPPGAAERTTAAARSGTPRPASGQASTAPSEQPTAQTPANAPAEVLGPVPAESAAMSAPVASATGTAASLPPTAAAVSGQGIVRLQFARDAWVEIKDRDGNRIMNQLGKAGTERSAQGIPPLRLVIGAASSVKVHWNDQPVDIAPYTKVDVARFTLE